MKRKLMISLISMAGLLGLIVPHSAAFAYTFTYGYGMATRTPSVKNYSSYSSNVSTAVNYWYNLSDVKPFVCSSCSSYYVSVANSWTLPSNIVGQAKTYTSRGKIIFADIVVNHNSGYFPQYSTNLRNNILGHELGHAWGLNHSQYEWALMWESTNSYNKYGVYYPQTDDRNGVNALY